MHQAITELPIRRGVLSVPPQEVKQDGHFSLGQSVVECHGVTPGTRPIVTVNNFVPEPDVAAIPEPDGDVYLSFLAVSALQRCDNPRSAVSFPLPPGLEKYYRELGVLGENNSIIEVPLQPGENGKFGYPWSDPLSSAQSEGIRMPDESFLVPTFLSDSLRGQAIGAGSTVVQRSQSAQTNDKVLFHNSARGYGYKTPDGMVLNSAEDLDGAVRKFQDAQRVWIKLDRGSGGDLVLPIKAPIDIGSIMAASDQLRESMRHSFEQNHLGADAMQAYWPDGEAFPPGGHVLIQHDATYLGPGRTGEFVFNGSNSILVRGNGEIEVVGNYIQMTESDGSYLGGRPYTPDAELNVQLEEQMRCVGQLCHDLNLQGIIGVDYIVVRDPASGKEFPVLIEMNGRPSINGTASVIADKLGTQEWINCNIWVDGPLNNIGDFEKALTIDGVNYARPSEGRGFVFPQAMRALHSRGEDGELVVIKESNAAKVLIGGESPSECDRIVELLKAEHIKFSSE